MLALNEIGFPPADAMMLTEAEAAAYLEAYVELKGGSKSSGSQTQRYVSRRKKRKG